MRYFDPYDIFGIINIKMKNQTFNLEILYNCWYF